MTINAGLGHYRRWGGVDVKCSRCSNILAWRLIVKRLDKFWLDHMASPELSSLPPYMIAYCRMLFYAGAAAMVAAMDNADASGVSDEQIADELRTELAEEYSRADAETDADDIVIAEAVSSCDNRADLIRKSKERLVKFNNLGSEYYAKLERENLAQLQADTGPDA